MSQVFPPLNLLPNAPGTPTEPATPLSGDVTGTSDNSTVVKVEGNPFEAVTYGADQDGYILTWVFDNNQVEAKPLIHPPAWDQEQWWIDPINGNDSNDGLTAATAIKTAREYKRRVGIEHLFTKDIIMTIMSDLPDTDLLDLSSTRPIALNYQSNKIFFFHVYGLSTVVASGTAIARQLDQLNNIANGLSCTALGSLASYILPGRMIKKTSGSNSSDTIDWTTKSFKLATGMWLAKDEDGTIARMSFPAYLDDLGFSQVQCGQGVFNTGDTFDIIDLCKIPVIELPESGNGFRFLRINFTQAHQTLNDIHDGVVFVECSMGFMSASPGGSRPKWTNGQINGPILYMNLGASINITYGLIKGVTLFMPEGRVDIQNYTLIQSSSLESNSNFGASGGISCHTRGFGIYDSPGAGIFITMGQVWQIAGTIYGSGNAGYAIEIAPGGKILAQAPSLGGKVFCLTGNTGDIKINGKTSGPAVDTTNPYAYTADRSYTLANLSATVASGGFDHNIFDPLNPSTAIVKGSF